MKRVNFLLALFSMMLFIASSFAAQGRGQGGRGGPSNNPGVTANAGNGNVGGGNPGSLGGGNPGNPGGGNPNPGMPAAEMSVAGTPVGVKETPVVAIPMQAVGIRVEAATQVAEIRMAGTPAVETVATLAAIRVATIPAVGAPVWRKCWWWQPRWG